MKSYVVEESHSFAVAVVKEECRPRSEKDIEGGSVFPTADLWKESSVFRQ